MIDNLTPAVSIAHGSWISWQPELATVLIIGNLLIALSCFTVPLIILKFIRDRTDIDFKYLHWLFAGFIVTCGFTHLLHIIELWYPVYYLEVLMDMLTAFVIMLALILLWKLKPLVVTLPSRAQLRAASEALKKLTDDIKDREIQLLNLGNSLPDSFLYQYTLNEGFPVFLFLSSGVERTNGVKVDHVLQDAMVLLAQIAPAQRETYAAAQAVSLQCLNNFSMELQMQRPDGEWRWLQFKSHPRKNNEGLVVWDGIATDITDRHLFEMEINRLAQAIEQNPTGVVITDTNGVLEYMNSACSRISGYQFADFYIEHRTPREIISSELTEAEYGDVQSQLMAGKLWSGVIRNRHKSGRLYWEQINVSPIYNNEGKVASYLYLRSDVTEQINADTDLKLRSAELERANADLTRFSDVSAHHFMEPTRRLISYAQKLRTRVNEMPDTCQDHEVMESLNYIERDAFRLRTLIRDVQLYLAAGMPRGEIQLEDPNELLASHLHKMPPNMKVEMTTLPQVMLDRARLNDLFGVLLDNALKHGQPADPDVLPVICISGEREGALSRFRISDNGCGIPSEYLERVFEIFERLSHGSDGGAGIGLSIARRIVESRHGKMWIENLPAGGAMVVFELPDGVAS